MLRRASYGQTVRCRGNEIPMVWYGTVQEAWELLRYASGPYRAIRAHLRARIIYTGGPNDLYGLWRYRAMPTVQPESELVPRTTYIHDDRLASQPVCSGRDRAQTEQLAFLSKQAMVLNDQRSLLLLVLASLVLGCVHQTHPRVYAYSLLMLCERLFRRCGLPCGK